LCWHAPQFVDEVKRFASQPSEARPLQLPKPGSHVATAHAPSVHADVALARAHGVHKVPQVFTLVLLAHAPEQMW
jgi:hypothetical protein